jgi:succinyl-CoA synthetase beta subunit
MWGRLLSSAASFPGGHRVKIHEYQAKGVLRRFGVPVPRGEAVETAEDARRVAAELGGGTVVVKAQIHAGGRGKGTFQDGRGTPVLRPDGSRPQGGVAVVSGPTEAAEVAARMLGNVLVTKQSGPEGRQVRRVLVEEGMQIAREVYLAVLVDRAVSGPVFIASAEGGTEIEEVAAARPEAILRVAVDPRSGYTPWMGRRLAYGLGFKGEQAATVGKLVGALHAAFMGTDASLVEVNPLVALRDGRVVALDAKVNFDDSALYRHPELRDLRDLTEEDPLEVEAGKYGLNYIKLDGNVACMVNGAGLAMGTMDIIQHHGGRPANFPRRGGRRQPGDGHRRLQDPARRPCGARRADQHLRRHHALRRGRGGRGGGSALGGREGAGGGPPGGDQRRARAGDPAGFRPLLSRGRRHEGRGREGGGGGGGEVRG